MCGIAGFSLTEGSKINARELANALLTSIETRGNMASGYAWAKADGQHGDYRQAIGGSQLPLKGLPRNARTVILHTRFTTHGPASDNRNNHPVQSPDGTIMLTHNGVIWNEHSLRYAELKDVRTELPVVDTSVIPALLQVRGIEGLTALQGDAAIAWLDTSTADTLHLARLQSSPVAYTWLLDGSFVYASTAAHLFYALDALDLLWVGSYPDPFQTMDELDYFQIDSGNAKFSVLAPIRTYNYASGAYGSAWRNATSGGHGHGTANQGFSGSGVTTVAQRALEAAKKPISKSGANFLDEYDYDAEADEWYERETGMVVTDEEMNNITDPSNKEYRWNGKVVSQTERSMQIDEIVGEAVLDEKTERYVWTVGGAKVVWSDSLQTIVPLADVDRLELENSARVIPMVLHVEEDDNAVDGEMSTLDRFYTMDHDGDYQGYRSFQAFVHALVWHAGLSGGAYSDQLGAEGAEKWVEHFQDAGFVLDDTLMSYVQFPDMTFDHDDDYQGGLGFIRSGAALLERLAA
jgi:hypothetical protein